MLTQNPVSALQFVGVSAFAEVVDEIAELVDVLQALGHHHLLTDQVRLRQVGASLGKGRNQMKII